MTKAGKTPHYDGVSVSTVTTAGGTRYVSRYTLRDGKRPTAARSKDWTEAFTTAVELQKKVDRGAFGSPEGRTMTVEELVTDFWTPTTDYKAKSKGTRRSHLGNATAEPNAAGAKNERAAEYSILGTFGKTRLCDLDPKDITAWQKGMIDAGYGHTTVLAKRSLFQSILAVAVMRGWMDFNYVMAVPRPKRRATGRKATEGRGLLPAEFNMIRPHVLGETAGLMVDVKLEAGLRFQTVSGLRAMDVIGPGPLGTQHLYVRQAVNWPVAQDIPEDNVGPDGKKLPYLIEGDKTEDWFRTSIGPETYQRLVAYIDQWKLTPEALIFDHGRIRAEMSQTREEITPPVEKPRGRYVNPSTGRSGEHGRYWTYNYGCHCLDCKNANTEYRFWLARAKGRPALQPWREPGFLQDRHDAVDPLPYWVWYANVWTAAVKASGLDWRPRPHLLRHAMVTWSLEGGATLRQVQRDANHRQVQTTQVYVDKVNFKMTDERVNAFKKFAASDNSDKPLPEESSETGPLSPFERVFTRFLKSMSEDERSQMMDDWQERQEQKARPTLTVVNNS